MKIQFRSRRRWPEPTVGMPRQDFMRGPGEAADFQREAIESFLKLLSIRDHMSDIEKRACGLGTQLDIVDELNLFTKKQWPVLFWRASCAALVTDAASTYPIGAESIYASEYTARPAYWPEEPLALCVFDGPCGPPVRMSGQPAYPAALLWCAQVSATSGRAILTIRLFMRELINGKAVVAPFFHSSSTPFEHVDPISIEQSDADMASWRQERERLTKWACAASMFIQQRVVLAEKPKWSDQARRISVDNGLLLDAVKVVQLRATKDSNQIDQHIGSAVAWSCQWLVRGHWRQQWFPKRRSHVPVWVHPHVKGPEGKPLKQSPVVFSVSR